MKVDVGSCDVDGDGGGWSGFLSCFWVVVTMSHFGLGEWLEVTWSEQTENWPGRNAFGAVEAESKY